jgi:predicted porin
MKKTLIAVAALSAMAASAMAANVTVYGVIDTGFHFQHSSPKWSTNRPGVKTDKATQSTNKFDMATGQNSGSRLGFKGVEELGNGMKVGFILENGFKSDTGADDDASLAFRREANLYVMTDFGTLSLARVGALTSTAGSYNLAKYTPFGGGWADSTLKQADFMLGDRARMDNTVTYVSPSFAGVKAYAQYSFQRGGKETAGNERQNDRYAGFGLTFDQGDFSTALVVDSVLYNYKATNRKDSLGVTWGASYNFGVAKVFAQAQYGKHENAFGFKNSDVLGAFGAYSKALELEDKLGKGYSLKVTDDEGVKGYGLSLGMTAPVAGGTFMAQVNYLDTKSVGDIFGKGYDKGGTAVDTAKATGKAKNWGAAVAYSYSLSKRTTAYTYASYTQLKKTWSYKAAEAENKTKNTEVGIGLIHKF